MPNPHSPGYHAHTEHGRLHLSAPHLSSYLSPSGLTGLLCSACLPCLSPHLHWAAGHQYSDVLPSCSQQVRSQRREARGWPLAGSTLAASTFQPPHGGNRARAEHGLPSTFLHPHGDLAPSGAAVHDLHQSCGEGAGRGGVSSATCSAAGAAHK